MPALRGRIDIDAALDESQEALELWHLSQQFPGVPLYSGGLVDAWPAWAVQALAICREEFAAVQALKRHEARKDANRG